MHSFKSVNAEEKYEHITIYINNYIYYLRFKVKKFESNIINALWEQKIICKNNILSNIIRYINYSNKKIHKLFKEHITIIIQNI